MPVMLRCTPGSSPSKRARKKSEMVDCVLEIKRQKCVMGMNIVDNYFAALCLLLAVSCRAYVSSFVSECSRE
jgi:hypothetical protein